MEIALEAGGLIHENKGNTSRSEFKVVRLVNKRRVSLYAGGRYQREYPKGAIVEAEPGSVGLLAFEENEQAEEFATHHWGIVIRVLGLEAPLFPKVLSVSQKEEKLDHFYDYKNRGQETVVSPKGTIAFRKVEVLE